MKSSRGWAFDHTSSSILPSAGNDVTDVFGTSPRGPKDAYVYSYFENVASGSSDTNVIQSITGAKQVNINWQHYF